MSKETYPTRHANYLWDFTRNLFRSCAAQDIGRDACLLLIYIAELESFGKCTGPVRLWSSQAMQSLGMATHKQLDAARKRAMAAGWLHYEPNHGGRSGEYWVLVPSTGRA